MFQNISALRPQSRNGAAARRAKQAKAEVGWKETYQGGSAAAERREFEKLAKYPG